jgi:hypothetical protein
MPIGPKTKLGVEIFLDPIDNPPVRRQTWDWMVVTLKKAALKQSHAAQMHTLERVVRGFKVKPTRFENKAWSGRVRAFKELQAVRIQSMERVVIVTLKSRVVR